MDTLCTVTYPGVKINFYDIDINGIVTNKKTGRPVKPYIDGKGYVRIALQSTKSNGKRIDVGLHRLICWEFNGPYNDSTDQVNHKDGCKSNNDPLNLEWCTNGENVKHAIDTGLLVINRQYDYDIEVIRTACDLIILGLTNMEITDYIYNGLDIHSEEQGNFLTTLGCIRAGKSYQNIFEQQKIAFNPDAYKNIDIDNIKLSLKKTRTNVTDKNMREEIKQYRLEGYNKIDILEKITGYRTSSATVFTKRVYKMISDIFK